MWLDSQLDSLKVHACFAGTHPSRLHAAAPQAGDYLRDVRVVGGRPVPRTTIRGNQIRLSHLPRNSCIAYMVDLDGAARQPKQELARRVGGDLLTSPGVWLWRPRTLKAKEDIELIFRLPRGLSVSAPWKRVHASGRTVMYRIGHRPPDWPAVVAFGRFRVERLRVAGTTLRLTLLDGVPPRTDAEKIRGWLSHAARTVGNAYGTFPVPSPQVLVIPRGRGGEPVPFAFVVRGGGEAAQFSIDQRRPYEEFLKDWTATHEFSHMLLPFIDRNEAWLSEGVASYYQNVLRARIGDLTPEQAWQELHAGFQRGIKGMAGLTLDEASRNMYRDHAFMRVYWTGAAIALLADVRLREQSAGRQSLDGALAELRTCCLPSDRMWSARELMERLDAITRTSIFRGLYDEYAHARRFPDFLEAYRKLGLRAGEGTLQVVPGIEFERLRAAIMRPHALPSRTARPMGVQGDS